MRYGGKVAVGIFILMVLLSVGASAMGHGVQENGARHAVTLNGVRYIEHDPIRINNDTEFEEFARAENLSGNGTPDNPYIITGLSINGSAGNDGIFIGNTTVYFVIENCYIYYSGFLSAPFFGGNGITVYNSTHGILRNNTLYNNEEGIQLRLAHGITVIHNSNTGGIGLEVNMSSNNTIVGNSFNKGGVGMAIWQGSEYNIVEDNLCEANTVGMDIFLSPHNVFINNTFVNNFDDSIYLDASPHNEFYSNTMLFAGFGMWGDLETFTTQTISANNTVNHRPLYYITSVSNGVAPQNAGEIILGNVTNYTVVNQDLEYCSVGVLVGHSSNVHIVNNTFKENHLADIVLMHTNNSTVADNQVNSGYLGIYMSTASWNVIVNNTIFATGDTGIYMERESTHNMILNNSFAGGSMGVELNVGCDYNTVSGNTIADTQNVAVDVVGASYTVIKNNVFYDNPRAIKVGMENIVGVSTSGFGTLYTRIYGNNMTGAGVFIHGDEQTFFTMELPANNTVNGKPVYFFKNQSDISIPSDAGEVILGNVSNVSIVNMRFDRVTAGLEIAFSANISVENCSFTNNTDYGVYIDGSSHVLVQNSTFLFNQVGIGMTGPSSQYNTVVHNLFAENSGYGVSIRDGSYNRIYNNSFYLNAQTGENVSNSRQASDNGYDNYWNTTAPAGGHGYGNYWYDWANNNTTNDENPHDGIVDWPYVVGMGKDYYPLKNATYPMPPLPPTRPEAIFCTAGAGYLNVSWTPPASNGSAPITEYRIYKNGVYLTSVPANQTWYKDTDVEAGVTYYYYVTAVNRYGEGAPSTPTRGTPEPVVPELPNMWVVVLLVALAGLLQRKMW